MKKVLFLTKIIQWNFFIWAYFIFFLFVKRLNSFLALGTNLIWEHKKYISLLNWTQNKSYTVPLLSQNLKDHLLPTRIINQFKHKIQIDFSEVQENQYLFCLWKILEYSKQSCSCNYNYSCNRRSIQN